MEFGINYKGRSRYIARKINEPYQLDEIPNATSPVNKNPRASNLNKPDHLKDNDPNVNKPSSARPYRRPASKPLGYNPFAKYRNDEICDYPAFSDMRDRDKVQPIEWEYDQVFGEGGVATIPALNHDRQRRRAEAKEEEQRKVEHMDVEMADNMAEERQFKSGKEDLEMFGSKRKR